MRLPVRAVIYFYIFICVVLLLFNLLYIFRYTHDPDIARQADVLYRMSDGRIAEKQNRMGDGQSVVETEQEPECGI